MVSIRGEKSPLPPFSKGGDLNGHPFSKVEATNCSPFGKGASTNSPPLKKGGRGDFASTQDFSPTHAMVLAAGFGLRMQPLTKTCPKPLIPVAGRSMIDRVMDHLDLAGVAVRVVNCHWLGEQLHDHYAGRDDVFFSDEDIILETGGGVAKALPLLGELPFFVCNADIVWTNGQEPALLRLAKAWNPEKMDALLLLQPVATAFGYAGQGDFFLHDDGCLQRRGTAASCPYIFAGVQILKASLFKNCPSGAFSLNILYDKAAATGGLKGLVHDGGWYHIGTPEALFEVEGRIPPAPLFQSGGMDAAKNTPPLEKGGRGDFLPP